MTFNDLNACWPHMPLSNHFRMNWFEWPGQTEAGAGEAGAEGGSAHRVAKLTEATPGMLTCL